MKKHGWKTRRKRRKSRGSPRLNQFLHKVKRAPPVKEVLDGSPGSFIKPGGERKNQKKKKKTNFTSVLAPNPLFLFTL